MDKSTVLNTAGREDVGKCYICLSPFENQTVGSLQSCQHVFCLQCILQWSQDEDLGSFLSSLLKKGLPSGLC